MTLDPCALPLSLFDYQLPEDLIANTPARPRDASRLLSVSRASGAVSHHHFRELADLLQPHDLMIVNRTEVIPARLHLTRQGGEAAELLLTEPLDQPLPDAKRWLALGRPGRALKPGKTLRAPDGTRVLIEERHDYRVVVSSDEPLWGLLTRYGEVPLPPYIRRPGAANADDREDYQSIFAREPGAVAAPTASLHFTSEVVTSLQRRGISLAPLVLHVGPGTFLPVREDCHDDVRLHAMHAEHYSIPTQTLEAIAAVRQNGGRVVAIGTTAVRALETHAATGVAVGRSQLFVYPGFEFKVIDGMVTNFHLPCSTLLMLVAAFMGRERMLNAYAVAVHERYRFFSYGDAMLIL